MASTRERNGRWTALYRGADGKQKSAGTFDSETEALARAQVAELDDRPPRAVEVHPAQKRGKITVAAYAPEWLENQDLLESTSRETYGRTADRIVRHLGGMAREDVTPDDVRKMIRALKKDGLRDATISATLDLARGLLGKQACADVRYRIKDRREMKCVTRHQAKAVEGAIHPRCKLLVAGVLPEVPVGTPVTALSTPQGWLEDVPLAVPAYVPKSALVGPLCVPASTVPTAPAATVRTVATKRVPVSKTKTPERIFADEISRGELPSIRSIKARRGAVRPPQLGRPQLGEHTGGLVPRHRQDAVAES